MLLDSKRYTSHTRTFPIQIASCAWGICHPICVRIRQLDSWNQRYVSTTVINLRYSAMPTLIAQIPQRSASGLWGMSGVSFKGYQMTRWHDWFDGTILIC